MTKKEVQIGKTYYAKISGKIVPVLIKTIHFCGGWIGVNTITGRDVRIKSAAKLRREAIIQEKP